MATVTPPYADPGLAAFDVLDTYQQNFLLAGNHPELKPAYSYPLSLNSTFAQFSVVGLDAAGKLALATLGAAAAAAAGALTFSTVGVADETITIGGEVYVLKAAAAAANEVTIGGTATATADNLTAAINGAAGEGTLYGTGTLAHPEVSASAAAGVITITAKQVGDEGNDIVTTETSAAAAFGSATLTGGRDTGGVQPIGVLAHAAALGGSGTGSGAVWYSGAFNSDALVWDASFATDADKEAAFRGAPTPTAIIISKR